MMDALGVRYPARANNQILQDEGNGEVVPWELGSDTLQVIVSSFDRGVVF